MKLTFCAAACGKRRRRRPPPPCGWPAGRWRARSGPAAKGRGMQELEARARIALGFEPGDAHHRPNALSSCSAWRRVRLPPATASPTRSRRNRCCLRSASPGDRSQEQPARVPLGAALSGKVEQLRRMTVRIAPNIGLDAGGGWFRSGMVCGALEMAAPTRARAGRPSPCRSPPPQMLEPQVVGAASSGIGWPAAQRTAPARRTRRRAAGARVHARAEMPVRRS
jgi:hypothetical protein